MISDYQDMWEEDRICREQRIFSAGKLLSVIL